MEVAEDQGEDDGLEVADGDEFFELHFACCRRGRVSRNAILPRSIKASEAGGYSAKIRLE